ncbi:MAG: endonuclease/exonuclease/phosphatase family metal-dependent hydrolase [Saprospiraceae bacterium]|jgi:endonuclease/exonuclease/phosphatase family metal-dependent hydrolase
MRIILNITFLLLTISMYGQAIRIDGNFDDWADIDPIFVDDTNDGQSNGIDLEKVWAYNDQTFLYFRFELNKEINLQENNDLAIYLDYDNDINTGFKINGIGAEVRVFFGDRQVILTVGNDTEFVNFWPIRLNVSPSVSGTEFEIAVSRSISESGLNITADNIISIRLEDNGFNGDEAPGDLGGIDYNVDNSIITERPEFDLDIDPNSTFRFMTYNIENDQLFEPFRKQNFRRIFQAINPDVIALQEVRDFNSSETMALIEEFLPGTWYHKKHGFDIVTLSRYPINFSENINGNAAFYLDINGKEVLLVNCHLPCCDNNSDRQGEVDGIMRYIREAREGNEDYPLPEDTPVIIAGDMNFVGNNDQPNTFLTGDIFSNGTYGEDFIPDWDGTNFEDLDASSTGTFGNFTWVNPFGSFFPGKLDWVIYTGSQMKVQNSFALWTSALTPSELNEYNLSSEDILNAADHLPVVADFNFSTVSTEDFVSIDVKIYPNPVSDKMYIQLGETLSSKFTIYNAEGIRIKTITNDESNIQVLDLNELNVGQYYILFQNGKGRMAKGFSKI